MFQDGQVRVVAKLVGVAAIIALLAYTYYAYVQARQVTDFPVTITVEGKGELFAKPDVATFTFNVNAKEVDAVAAQNGVAETMKNITAYLKGKGVEEKDIKTTGYTLNPRYEYPQNPCMNGYCPPPGEPKQIGFEVTQTVMVKVRETKDAGMLISGVGEQGAENVGSLAFTIDDEETLRGDARAVAIADAQAKAQALADKLGVRLGRMTGYWENGGGISPLYSYGGAAMDMAMTKEMAVPAEIPMGENTILVNVSLSYEIK